MNHSIMTTGQRTMNSQPAGCRVAVASKRHLRTIDPDSAGSLATANSQSLAYR